VTTLECIDTSFVPDHLPRPGVVGAGRVSGISLDSARIRTVLAAVVTLAPAPGGFTVADLTTKVHALTGKTHYTTRQGAYDLRKLPGKHLIDKPGRGRRYQIEPIAVRTVTALLTLREQVIAPILAGVRDPDPATATTCTSTATTSTCAPAMRALFDHLGIATEPAAT